MLFKSLLVIFIFYMLVKFISRFFLPNPNKKGGNFSFFYQTFKNVREQQKQTENGSVKNKLDDIEEAEFEEITDESDAKS